MAILKKSVKNRSYYLRKFLKKNLRNKVLKTIRRQRSYKAFSKNFIRSNKFSLSSSNKDKNFKYYFNKNLFWRNFYYALLPLRRNINIVKHSLVTSSNKPSTLKKYLRTLPTFNNRKRFLRLSIEHRRKKIVKILRLLKKTKASKFVLNFVATRLKLKVRNANYINETVKLLKKYEGKELDKPARLKLLKGMYARRRYLIFRFGKKKYLQYMKYCKKMLAKDKSGRNKYAPNEYVPNQSVQTQDTKNKYGHNKYAQNKYGHNKYGQNKYVQNKSGQDKYAQNKYGQNKYVQNKYGQNKYVQNEDEELKYGLYKYVLNKQGHIRYIRNKNYVEKQNINKKRNFKHWKNNNKKDETQPKLEPYIPFLRRFHGKRRNIWTLRYYVRVFIFWFIVLYSKFLLFFFKLRFNLWLSFLSNTFIFYTGLFIKVSSFYNKVVYSDAPYSLNFMTATFLLYSNRSFILHGYKSQRFYQILFKTKALYYQVLARPRFPNLRSRTFFHMFYRNLRRLKLHTFKKLLFRKNLTTNSYKRQILNFKFKALIRRFRSIYLQFKRRKLYLRLSYYRRKFLRLNQVKVPFRGIRLAHYTPPKEVSLNFKLKLFKKMTRKILPKLNLRKFSPVRRQQRVPASWISDFQYKVRSYRYNTKYFRASYVPSEKYPKRFVYYKSPYARRDMRRIF